MWRLEKDPYLSSTVGQHHGARSPGRLRAVPRRLDRASRVVPRLRQRVQPTPVSLTPPIWVDDPEFDLDYHVRHVALPKPGSLRQLLRAGHADRRRPLRPHPAAVGVLRGRRPEGRPGGHHPEAPPHGGRRRGQHPALDAVHRSRPVTPRTHRCRPKPETAGRRAARPATVDRRDTLRDLLAGSLRMPIGISRQFTGPADRSHPDPHGRDDAGRDRPRACVSQLSDIETAHSTGVDRAVAAPPAGDAAAPRSTTPRRPPRAGRHAQHRVHLRRRRRRPASTTEGGRPGRAAPGLDGRQHPHPGVGLQRLLAGPDAGPHRGDGHGRALPR